jgi:hypothetical protein
VLSERHLVSGAAGGKNLAHVVKIVYRNSKLPHVVRTRRPPRGFAGGLDGWQQERDKHADDSDDHEQFNQREPSAHDETRSIHSLSPQGSKMKKLPRPERMRVPGGEREYMQAPDDVSNENCDEISFSRAYGRNVCSSYRSVAQRRSGTEPWLAMIDLILQHSGCS